MRVDPRAERMAIDTALEVGARLILANMLLLRPYPMTIMIAREYATLPHEEDLDAVRATASSRRARSGSRTELLRVSSPRPLTALIELAHERERRPARVRAGPLAHLRGGASARRPRSCGATLPCLVWIAPD